jgi:hypothetical protein
MNRSVAELQERPGNTPTICDRSAEAAVLRAAAHGSFRQILKSLDPHLLKL